jgi:SAM-dependent methyltransferase
MPDKAPQLSTWRRAKGDLDFEAVVEWFVGDHCNRYPLDRALAASDILLGWEPEQKFILRDTKVLAFGSCFAEYFVKFLAQHGYNHWQNPVEKHGLSEESLLLSLGQTFENIFVIVQQLRWAFGEFTPQSALWFTKDKQYFEATEERRENIRNSFVKADVIVVTLGLSEVWFDKLANEPMWRPITANLYDPERHIFKSATVAETLQALYDFDRLAHEMLPEKRFIFTLSPIPLLATLRDQSAITADTASKAKLRAALDEFFSDPAIRGARPYYYFPSYELVFRLFDHPFGPDNRHVRPEVAAAVLSVFSSLYTDLPPEANQIEADAAGSLQRRVLELEVELECKEEVLQELNLAAQQRLALLEGKPLPDLSPPEQHADRQTPGMRNFFSQNYARINEARLAHLASLGLPLAGRSVLEVGAGPGHLTGFYVDRNCRILATDSRSECIDEISRTFPTVRTAIIDMNNAWPLRKLGQFEIVHVYGVLYHLENPDGALEELSGVCSDLLLLETCVSPQGKQINLVPEAGTDFTQSSTSSGCRPGREWVFERLQGLFPYVYQTRTQPDHEQFPLDWTAVGPDHELVRIVLVASRNKLDNPLLSPVLLDHQERFKG